MVSEVQNEAVVKRSLSKSAQEQSFVPFLPAAVAFAAHNTVFTAEAGSLYLFLQALKRVSHPFQYIVAILIPVEGL